MERAQGGGLGSRPGGSTARRTRPAPWWLRLELSTTTACAQRERPAARPHRRRRQQRALRQRLVMVDMLQLAARGVDELCARLVKGERERCKLQDATTKTLLRTKVRARAHSSACSSVLLCCCVLWWTWSRAGLISSLLLSFTAMLGLRKLQRRVVGAPDAARGAVYPPPRMPPPHWATRGYRGSIARPRTPCGK